MGEAKRKSEKAKKRGRGLVISPPVQANGGTFYFKGDFFDPFRLRLYALFLTHLLGLELL